MSGIRAVGPHHDDHPTEARAEARPVITVYEDGPLVVRGNVDLRGMDGTPIDSGRATVALCRCGRSAIKPFCDGTHTRARFSAEGGDERK